MATYDAPVAQAARLKNYLLVRHLAMGGMGEVWLARQDGPAGFSRPVVIKRILPAFSADEHFVELFLAEARLAARLTHPNIVQVIELSKDGGEWFMAMEYVHGRTLRALHRAAREQGKRLDPVMVAAIASQALVGLQYAHQLTDEQGQPLGLVHRDASPDNLMVSFDGTVKVLDFGIAKVTSAVSTTQPGQVRGKLSYLSPEQVRGETLDGRSDVFSIGVVLYELFTGQRPFTGDSDAAKMMQVLEHTPPEPAALEGQVPAPLSRVVTRALQKDPAERYPSAEAMHLALDAAIAELGQRVAPSHLAAWLREVAGDPGVVDLTPTRGTATFHRQGSAPGPADRRVWWLALGLLAVFVASVAVGLAVFGRREPSMAVDGAGPRAVEPEQVSAVADAGEPAARVAVVADGGDAPEPALADAGSSPVLAVDTSDAATATTRTAAPGRVQFLIRPWAEVFVGGRSLGITPMSPVTLPPGRVTFLLKNERLGVEKRVTVVVKAGQLTTVREVLKD